MNYANNFSYNKLLVKRYMYQEKALSTVFFQHIFAFVDIDNFFHKWKDIIILKKGKMRKRLRKKIRYGRKLKERRRQRQLSAELIQVKFSDNCCLNGIDDIVSENSGSADGGSISSDFYPYANKKFDKDDDELYTV